MIWYLHGQKLCELSRRNVLQSILDNVGRCKVVLLQMKLFFKGRISQFSKIRQIKCQEFINSLFTRIKKKYTKSMVFEFCPHKPLILQFKYNHASRATSPKHTFFPILENSGCIFSFSTGCLHF